VKVVHDGLQARVVRQQIDPGASSLEWMLFELTALRLWAFRAVFALQHDFRYALLPLGVRISAPPVHAMSTAARSACAIR
jgi:hypothetical protein